MLRIVSLLLCCFVLGSAFSLSVTVSVQNQVCSTPGSCYANASGGVPPYTYLWNTGATTPGINSLGVGTYSVTVTDNMGTQAAAQGTVVYTDHTDQWTLTGDAYCPPNGMLDPFARWSPMGVLGDVGPPPYSFNGVVVPQDPYPDQELYNVPIPALPGESVQMQYMDGNGCGGTFWATAGYPVQWPTVNILGVEGACSGGANGSILVAYGAEGHGYSVDTEIRDASLNIVVQGGNNWYGTEPTTLAFAGLAAGNYYLYQRLTMAVGSNYYNGCADQTLFTIPDLGVGCGHVNGTVYMDYNENCLMGGSETRVPGAILEFQPGPYYTMTNSNGDYAINLPTGAYTVEQIASDVAQYCPAPPAPVNVSGTQTLNIADTSLVALDAQVMIGSGPARPGFQLHYAIQQTNLTPSSTGTTSVVLTFDPTVTFISSTPAPSLLSGNTITWNQSALGAFHQRAVQVRFQVPPDVGLIGMVLNASVVLTTQNTDAVLANNSASTSVTVTGSYDPNDKLANTSSRASDELYFIDGDEYIDYVIRFQNTGTDTAFNVIITDTLPTTLDPAKIKWGAASHAHTHQLVGAGMLKFIFPNILLPDSNANEPGSHGFVSFRIRPHQPVVASTVIENIANIFFDFNPPVITEPSVLVTEFSTGLSVARGEDGLMVYPNPTSGILVVELADAERIHLLDLAGRLLVEARVVGNRTLVPLDGLPAGVYLLRVTNARGQAFTRPVTKQ
jgi:uncharacterized repeat protein (TIGR01451 family)